MRGSSPRMTAELASPQPFFRALPRPRARASVDCKRSIVSRSTRRAKRPRGLPPSLATLSGGPIMIRGGAGIFSNEKAGTVIPLVVEPEHPLERPSPKIFFDTNAESVALPRARLHFDEPAGRSCSCMQLFPAFCFRSSQACAKLEHETHVLEQLTLVIPGKHLVQQGTRT
jgi:hypothetical protein